MPVAYPAGELGGQRRMPVLWLPGLLILDMTNCAHHNAKEKQLDWCSKRKRGARLTHTATFQELQEPQEVRLPNHSSRCEHTEVVFMPTRPLLATKAQIKSLWVFHLSHYSPIYITGVFRWLYWLIPHTCSSQRFLSACRHSSPRSADWWPPLLQHSAVEQLLPAGLQLFTHMGHLDFMAQQYPLCTKVPETAAANSLQVAERIFTWYYLCFSVNDTLESGKRQQQRENSLMCSNFQHSAKDLACSRSHGMIKASNAKARTSI